MKKPKPKRHHIVPESYQHGFTRDGMLSVFDRTTRTFRRQTPKNTAVMGHYYAVLNEQGERDYSVETMLSEFEGWGASAIRKLEERQMLSGEERLDLAYFVALLFTRVPRFEREMEEIADATIKAVAQKMYSSVEAAAARLAGSPDPHRTFSAQQLFEFIQ
jgi:hypothetical protein